MHTITPFLWFDGNAEAAAEFYVSVFPDSRITETLRYGEGMHFPAGTALTVGFELDGQRFTALNGGPQYTFSPATSFVIHCDDQADIDRYWAALGDGGRIQQCGWLTDRFGVTWQVVPRDIAALLGGDDPAAAGRAMQALMTMTKIDIATLQAARASS
ncbi:VOC family protein [Jeongeupia chitinilytica]|uniref:VOC family protein n=1 Tax=Jeongeupia chitinilytica TaxID=1041641 RepID=A0ABQ3H4D4_9NEIS|nr:VOC family protein [Jeongeupia chitinilytica]GHD67553.1 VOC family protein [Jeongeupia chitinilytica]